MISLVSMVALQVSEPDLLAVQNAKKQPVAFVNNTVKESVATPLNIYQTYTLLKPLSFKGYKQVFNLPEQNKTEYKNFNEVLAHYEKPMKNVI